MSDIQHSMIDGYEAELVYGPPPKRERKGMESEDGRIDFLVLPTLREAIIGLSIAATCLFVATLFAWKRIRRNR